VNHASNNVFPSAALSVDQDRDIGGSYFCQALAQSTHGFGAPEYNRLGRHLA
jgi:hypothetical protein